MAGVYIVSLNPRGPLRSYKRPVAGPEEKR